MNLQLPPVNLQLAFYEVVGANTVCTDIPAGWESTYNNEHDEYIYVTIPPKPYTPWDNIANYVYSYLNKNDCAFRLLSVLKRS